MRRRPYKQRDLAVRLIVEARLLTQQAACAAAVDQRHAWSRAAEALGAAHRQAIRAVQEAQG